MDFYNDYFLYHDLFYGGIKRITITTYYRYLCWKRQLSIQLYYFICSIICIGGFYSSAIL